VVLRERSDTVWTQEFIFIQHLLQDFLQPVLADQSKQQSVTLSTVSHAGNIPLSNIVAILDKPIKALSEFGEPFEDLRFKG
jgi:hypothetical protein